MNAANQSSKDSTFLKEFEDFVAFLRSLWGALAGISTLFPLSNVLILVSYYFLAINAFDILGWESADSRRLIGEILLLVLYSVFFAFVTRAFVLLGILEYFRQEKPIK